MSFDSESSDEKRDGNDGRRGRQLGPHRERAQEWLAWCWKYRRGRVSTQMVNEFHANALRKFSRTLPVPKARAETRRLWTWNPYILEEDTVEAAWALQDRFSLSYWDALMLAAALELGCRFLLTEDLQHDQAIDKLRIVNPFLARPDIIDAAAA